ncbi:hypothetical protein [Adlercreutzia sp. ZJ176]|uniref:hypothetical protein n=1 Tax=Adlercreutzia sp. ZJ176 TaxID=2709407 RepID=UPI0013EBEBA4|nr:hypothetical protein [Adlercreutzia sp. ZJ176]
MALACVVALAAMFFAALEAVSGYVGATGSDGLLGGFGFVDVLAYFFAGSDYYRIDDKVPFVLPIGWLIQQVLIAVLVGHYTVRDFGGQALQVFMRVGGRRSWWLSKCLWVVATVIVFYVAESVVALLAAAFGGFGAMGDVESIMVLGFPLSALDAGQTILLLLLPTVLSLALSLAQVALSLIVGPFMAFASVIVFVAVSAYFGSPLLIGDCSMMARSSFVQQGGVEALAALSECVIIGVVSVILGGVVLGRKDMVDGQDRAQ